MAKFTGGFSTVEVDSAVTFPSPTVITGILSDETTFPASTTSKKGLANGQTTASNKKMPFVIASTDVNNATWLTEIQNAEDNATPLFFRFTNLGGTFVLTNGGTEGIIPSVELVMGDTEGVVHVTITGEAVGSKQADTFTFTTS